MLAEDDLGDLRPASEVDPQLSSGGIIAAATQQRRAANSFQHKVFRCVNRAEGHGKVARVFGHFILVLILVNVAAVIIESEPVVQANAGANTFFNVLEWFSVIVFTGELPPHYTLHT